jgi:Nuclear transport factor 2 (NTF2) domain
MLFMTTTWVDIPLRRQSRSQNLPFQKVAHRITSLDAQPSSGGLLVLVTGQLLVGRGWLAIGSPI